MGYNPWVCKESVTKQQKQVFIASKGGGGKPQIHSNLVFGWLVFFGI